MNNLLATPQYPIKIDIGYECSSTQLAADIILKFLFLHCKSGLDFFFSWRNQEKVPSVISDFPCVRLISVSVN